MKALAALLMCLTVVLLNFRNSVAALDYQLNRAYYEARCENKGTPELQCHGKCQLEKGSGQGKSGSEFFKAGFEVSVFAPENPLIPEKIPNSFFLKRLKFADYQSFTISAFTEILPHPPQSLV